jgi:hypothetical protein
MHAKREVARRKSRREGRALQYVHDRYKLECGHRRERKFRAEIGAKLEPIPREARCSACARSARLSLAWPD